MKRQLIMSNVCQKIVVFSLLFLLSNLKYISNKLKWQNKFFRNWNLETPVSIIHVFIIKIFLTNIWCDNWWSIFDVVKGFATESLPIASCLAWNCTSLTFLSKRESSSTIRKGGVLPYFDLSQSLSMQTWKPECSSGLCRYIQYMYYVYLPYLPTTRD